MANISIIRAAPKVLRKIFNENRFWERSVSGELTTRVLKDRHPSLTVAQEPFCTRSQSVSYIDQEGNEVARVHQYLRTDLTIGASGRPDPKRVLFEGRLYIVQEAPPVETSAESV